VLRGLNPGVASFYILTPIPGTQQYDEFLADGWITEQNLDRYDATTTTWRHPTLSSAELRDALFRCYRKFYTATHILGTAIRDLQQVPRWSFQFKQLRQDFLPYVGHPVFTRFAAEKKMHPMSGGVRRVRLDSWSDYRELRRSRFGLDLVPLPKSLELSQADAELNRHVKLAI